MSVMNDLVAWLKQQRARLRQQVNTLESGEMRTRERRAGAGLLDTTADTLEHVERNLAEIEALLARHRKSQVELKAPRR